MNTEVESSAVEPTVDPTTSGAPEVAAPNPPEIVPGSETWEQLGVRDELRDVLLEMGYLQPMAVQRAVYPRMMAGKDVLVQSRTGSGKTAAFGIPFAQGLIDGEKKEVQALVLAPTRELALQVGVECEKIAAKRLHVIPIYGGAPMAKQIDQLKAGAQVVAGTPGRVLDHLRRGTLRLDGLKVLVLDEADEMLSMGFLEEITEIIKQCPTDRQTTLFSATIPEDIERIGSRYMRNPEKIALSADFIGVHEIKHTYYMVSGMGRARDLRRVLDVEKPDSAIIFCNTREDTALVAEFLRKTGMDAEAISSDLTQKDRERVMNRMKAKDLKYLVATDIAARGIDISDLSHVINYTFPESAEVYVHRTGRTGRAGKSGVAISLISPRELGNFYMLKLTYKIKPEERTLPSDEHLKVQLEAQRVNELRDKVGTREAAEGYRQLAKRVWAADDGERMVALLIEEKLTAHVEPVRAHAPERPAAGRSQAPRAAGLELEPLQSGGPTGGFSAPPAAQRAQAPRTETPRGDSPRGDSPRGDSPRGDSPRGDSPRTDGAAKTETAGARSAAAPAADGKAADGKEEGGERVRRRRGRRGGRGGERERREPDDQARRSTGAAQPSNGPAKRVAETIDASDGKEFWEAWVDSKSETPEAAAGGGAAAPSAEARGERNGNAERNGGERAERNGNGERNGGERNGGGERAERVETPLPEGHVRLYLNLGRRDGAREPEIEQLLKDRAIDGATIQVRNSHTYLIIADERADATIASLTGGKYAERDILCERARK